MGTSTGKHEQLAPDGGWGWMVVLAAFFLNLFSGGIFSVQGMLYEEFLYHYPDLTVTSAAWLISLQSGLCYIAALLNGPFMAVWTARQLTAVGSTMMVIGLTASSLAPNVTCIFLSFSLLTGLGMGFQCLPSSVLVQNYFDKYRALAGAIGLSGGSMGVFIFPPLARALMDEYGWRGTTMILAGIMMNSVPLALLLRPLQVKPATSREPNPTSECTKDPMLQDETKTTSNEIKYPVLKRKGTLYTIRAALRRVLNLSILKRKAPWVTMVVWFLAYCGGSSVYTSVTVKCSALNFSRTQAPYLISVIGITETVGRVLSGIVGNLQCVNRVYIFCAGTFLCGLSSVVSGYITNYVLLLVYAAVYGLNIGAFVGLGATIVVDIMGKEILPYALGFNLFAGGIGSFVALPVFALTLEISGDQAVPFVMLGSCFILASFVLLIFYLCNKDTIHKTVPHEITEKDSML